ncbi:MAG: FAD:protein FMN transferase [Holophagales bacterium]|nr:FAD:protein FMN transferase [Holophagales bacterium]
MSTLLVLASLLAAAPPAATALQSRGEVFGAPFTLEIRDLDRAAAEAAFTEAFAAGARVEADARALAHLVGGAGDVALSSRALALLERTQAYCVWSEGAVSVLGGPLYRLWGLVERAPGLPSADKIDAAVAATRCDRLTLAPAGPSARLAAGSEIHLFPFAQGWAADAILDAAREAGAKNAWVSVGVVQKGIGPGPGGQGWPVVAPPVPGAETPLDPFFLRDRAVAILSASDRPISVGGERHAPYLDLSRGRPSDGVLQVLSVSERALDAQSIAYAMFALGPRRGQFRLGGLDPAPSVLWQLGGGEGPPLLTESAWWKVPKR